MVKNTKRIVRNGKEYEINLEEGWNRPQFLEASKVLLNHVIETKGEPINYGDFCKKLSFEAYPEFVDRLFGPLGYTCLNSGLPPVSGIVVNKEEGLPGAGFIKSYYPQIKDEMSGLMKLLEIREEIKAFSDWDILLEAMNLI